MDMIQKQGGSEAACETISEMALTTVLDRNLPRSRSPSPVRTPSLISARVKAQLPPTVPPLDHQRPQSHRTPTAYTVDTDSSSEGELDPFHPGPKKDPDLFPMDTHNNWLWIKKKAFKERDFETVAEIFVAPV
ncbi:hypothetical protein Nmel_008264 [Mimus melanotis]